MEPKIGKPIHVAQTAKTSSTLINLTLEEFLETFFYTNSLNDYQISIQKLDKKHSLNLNSDFYNVIFTPLSKTKRLSVDTLSRKFVTSIKIEDKKEAHIPRMALDDLKAAATDLNIAARIEMFLVKKERAVASKLGVLNFTRDQERAYLSLIQLARYEVFQAAMLQKI